MADVNAALFAVLDGHAGLSALVASRIYPVRMPQGVTLPAVSYQQVSSRGYWQGGRDAAVDTLRYQVDAWGTDVDNARAVGAQVLAALRRYSGTAAGTVIQGVFLLTQLELYDDPTESYRVTADFEVHYETS